MAINKVTLDQNVMLSESSIWQQQCDFYKREGIAAWHNQVPFYATSNAYIAYAYADMIYAFMQDWHTQHKNQRFYIVELGAGCGQFSYLCLQQLQRLLSSDDYDWHYIMSDLDQTLLDFWRSHKGLRTFIETGKLDFIQTKIGDTLDDLDACLQNSDAPLIVIANYFFDSLAADIYHIHNETINAVEVTVSTASDNVDHHGTVIDFEKVTLDCASELVNAQMDNDILEQYRLELFDSYILYPTQALTLCDELIAKSKQGVFLLSSDKAYADMDELDYLSCPEITGHQGCFSLMMNYDAMRRYAELHDGDAFMPVSCAGIKTVAFGLSLKLFSLPNLVSTMQHYLHDFTPADYLNLYRNMQKNKDGFNLEEALSFLALSCWDATVFEHFYDRIFAQLDGADMLTINYLLEHLPVIADHYYWLEQKRDLLFQIAVIFHTLKRYKEALVYYERSLDYFGEVFGVYFNMGVCHHHLNQNQLARHCFEKAHALDPEDQKTQQWLDS